MGALIRKDEIDRIDLDGGEWVDICRRYTYGHLKAIRTSDTDAKLLLQAIVAWNITGEDGQVAEISEQVLDQLEISAFKCLVEEVMKRIPLGKLAPSTPISGHGLKEPAVTG